MEGWGKNTPCSKSLAISALRDIPKVFLQKSVVRSSRRLKCLCSEICCFALTLQLSVCNYLLFLLMSWKQKLGTSTSTFVSSYLVLLFQPKITLQCMIYQCVVLQDSPQSCHVEVSVLPVSSNRQPSTQCFEFRIQKQLLLFECFGTSCSHLLYCHLYQNHTITVFWPEATWYVNLQMYSELLTTWQEVLQLDAVVKQNSANKILALLILLLNFYF